MASQLYSGIKSLHLTLDTPYDSIRTEDVRSDLIGVKVWYSTTQGFNPALSEGTLVFDGLSQSVIISNLEINTRYYVRYAFISAIDPNTYTISSELTELVLDEGVSVYGYLTNDPTAVKTDSGGGGGNYSLTAGVFKVYDYSQDVTGAGPIYGIVPGEVYGGVSAYINPVTGAYSASSMTGDTGAVKFYADYNGIRVEKVWNISKTRDGVDATDAIVLTLSATGNAFVYADESASTTTAPAVQLTAQLQNITGDVIFTATAYTRESVLLGNITGTQSGNIYYISAEQFNPTVYANQVGYVLVTATLGTVSDSTTVYRINDGSEQITVEQTNQAHTITAYEDGTVPSGNYVGSGTIIKVKQGNTYLNIDNASPYQNGSWRISTVSSVGITADPTPTIGANYQNFDTHAAMTADVAYIDYTVSGKTTTGKDFEIITRQSFSKSKAGVAGSNAPVVTLTASTQVFVVAQNTSVVSPASATLTAEIINLPGATLSWEIDGVVQAATTSTLVVPNFSTGIKLIKVTATKDTVTVYDQLTIYAVSEGDDSISAGLVNENQTISCDATGEPIAGQLPVSSSLEVVRGAVKLTTSVVYSKVSETGMTSTINSSTGAISVTAITANFASATYRATIGTLTLDRVLTLNKSKDGATGAAGSSGTAGPLVDISGLTTFYQSSGGAITPSTQVLQAVVTNVTSPSYSWSIVGATPNTATGASVTVTPTGAASITITLTVTGANLTAPIVITRGTNIVQQGAVGQTGANGIMSAYPTIYIWTSSSGTPPARPSTTSTYTWSNGAYTAPTLWSTTAPQETRAGYALWTITVPLTVIATTTSSTLDWTNTSYPIRAISVNGANGTNGTSPTTYAMGLSAPVFNRSSLNVLTPVSLTITGSSTVGTTKSAYSGIFKIYEDTVLKTTTTAVSTYSYTPSVASVNLLKVEFYLADGTTLVDTQEVPIVSSGSNAIIVNVPNSADLLAADSTGVVSSYLGSGTTISVYDGDTALNYVASGSNYTITAYVKSINGLAASAQTSVKFAPSRVATDATVYYITSSARVITKTSPLARLPGTHSSITVQGKRIISGVTANYGWVTITGNNDLEATTATDTSVTALSFTPANAAGKSNYTIRLYDKADVLTATLLDSEVVEVAFTGVSGTRSAVLEMYRWSTGVPATFPSGSSTYTWASNTFTNPATLNSWTRTPGTGAAGQTLYLIRQLFADNLTGTTSSVTWSSIAPVTVAPVETAGNRVAYLELYQWALTPPTTFPSGTSTYTWSTGSFTNPATLNGWSQAPGSTLPGYTLYACSVIYNDALSDTTSIISWNTATAYIAGAANILKVISSNSNLIVPVTSAGIATWTGSDSTLQVYEGVTALTLGSTTQSTTTPVSNGLYVLNIVNSSGSVLTEPTIGGGSTTTAALTTWSGTLTSINATNSTFTVGIPYASHGSGIAVGGITGSGTVATVGPHSALGDVDSVTIYYPITYNRATGTRATQIVSQTIGRLKAAAAGAAGAAGTTGSATYLIDRGAGTNSGQPTAAEVLTAVGRYAQVADIATISYNNGSNSTAYRATSSGINAAWSLQTTYITGSLIVQNSISADRIIANTITADRIQANSIAAADQFSVNGSITQITPFGEVLTTTNTNLIQSFTIVNNSNTNSKLSIVGIGRTGALGFGVGDAQNFAVFDATGLSYFQYGWTPVGQDAKGFNFIYTIDANSTKTFSIRGCKTAASTLDFVMQVISLGIRN